MYQKNFGEFFNNQIEHASCLILSHTAGLAESKLEDCVQRLRALNTTAPIVTTDWEQLSGEQLLSAMNQTETLDSALKNLLEETEHEHEHDHDDHDHDESCGCHDHDHHHHHHADDVFTSWGKETVHKYTEEELDYLLKALSETTSYGTILRSKGIIQMTDGGWKQFDLVPEEYEVREGQPDYTGRICVIGTDLKEEELLKLFHV